MVIGIGGSEKLRHANAACRLGRHRSEQERIAVVVATAQRTVTSINDFGAQP